MGPEQGAEIQGLDVLGYLAEQEGGIFGRVLEVEHRLAAVFHVVVLMSSVCGEHGTKHKAYLP